MVPSQAEKRRGILELIARLEELQPAESPTDDLQRVAGAWKLLFSTISITVSSFLYSRQSQLLECNLTNLPITRRKTSAAAVPYKATSNGYCVYHDGS